MSDFILSAFADEIDKNLDKQMDVLDKNAISYIEMRSVNGKELVDFTLDEVREIKSELDTRGFKLSAIGSPIGKIMITDNFSKHLDLFKHTLEIAKIMEAKYIRMFSFVIPFKESPEKYRDEVMARWGKFIEVAKGTGITLLHENEKGMYGETAEKCLDLMKTLNCDFVKAVFDPANYVQSDVLVYPAAYNLLKDYIVYIHVKDALYSNHDEVPSGMGDGKLKEILLDLHNSNFKGFLSLEPHLGRYEEVSGGNKFHGCDNIDNTITGEYKFSIATNALKKILLEIKASY